MPNISQSHPTTHQLNLSAPGLSDAFISKETINLATGYYGKLPGRINDELLELVEKNQETISVRPADLIEDDMEERKKDLKNFCVQNNLKDFSEHEEYLLCFIQFPYSTTDYLKSLA